MTKSSCGGNPQGSRELAGSGTRIASISGLRGVVGDGLDPSVAVEFAAAYAGGCKPGPIVLGHDGRVSSAVFSAAVESSIMATGHDVLFAGPTATPTIGWLVRDLRGGRGHSDLGFAQSGPVQRTQVLSAGGHGAEPMRRARRCSTAGRSASFAGQAGKRLGTRRVIDEPDRGHLAAVLAIVDAPAIRGRGFKVVLDACHGAGGRMGTIAARGSWLPRRSCWAARPTGVTTIAPEPTEANLQEFAAMVPAIGAAVGFALDPDADRLAIVDENGRYIGEELTLALAATRRLGQEKGPVILEPLDLAGHRDARPRGRLRRVSDAGRRDQRRAADGRCECAPGRRRQRRRHRSAGGLRARQFRRAWRWCST